jgi:chromosome segregation ATPase
LIEGTEVIIDSLISSVRSFIRKEMLPAVESVRDVIQRNTQAYYVTGHARGPWIATMDELWDEFHRRHEEAQASTRLEAQRLVDAISAMEHRAEDIRLETQRTLACRDSSRAAEAACRDEIASLQQTIVSLQQTIADRTQAAETHVQHAEEAQVTLATLADEDSAVREELATTRDRLASLQRRCPHT